MGHGLADFTLANFHDIHLSLAYMGSEDLDYYERVEMIDSILQFQSDQKAFLDQKLMEFLSVDESDEVYQSFRSKTELGLEVGSLVVGGYGAVKGVMGFSKLAKMPNQISKIAKQSRKQLRGCNGFLGHKEFELQNPSYQALKNRPTNIQGRAYSSHALDQMQNRGFMPSVAEEAIQHGIVTPNKVPGRIQFYDVVNNISVVTEDGKVITLMHGRLN